ncbi:MAG TPA: hypothetical protein VGG57_05560 [Stellaceae bacterium]|jgi:hypothetical protein
MIEASFTAASMPIEMLLLGRGWGAPEPEGTWATGTESTITLPPAPTAAPYAISLRVRPLLLRGFVERQRISLYFNELLLGHHELVDPQATEITFAVPEAAVSCTGTNQIRLYHPDAAAPEAFGYGRDGRQLSVMVESFRMAGNETMAAADPPRILFIVMGACLPGQRPNLELVKFLYGDDVRILVWLDCLDPTDYPGIKQTIENEYPGVFVPRAPRALWGGPSIVKSMLCAIDYALANIRGWRQAMFVSTVDVPLVSKPRLLGQVSALRLYDFCGSRWTHPFEVVVKPELFIIGDEPAEPSYRLFSFRLDTHLQVDVDLMAVCTEEKIENRRITTTLAERYSFSVVEDFYASTLIFNKLTPVRAREREKFFQRFELVAGRMWVMCSRKFCQILSSDETTAIFNQGFADIFIADECFFQTTAHAFEQKGKISVLWKSLFYDGANPTIIDDARYRDILASAAHSDELFARKNTGIGDYQKYLAEAEEATG